MYGPKVDESLLLRALTFFDDAERPRKTFDAAGGLWAMRSNRSIRIENIAAPIRFNRPLERIKSADDDRRVRRKSAVSSESSMFVVATSKPQKDWLPERWAEVSDALYHDFGLQPVLVGGRSPRELAAEAVILEAAPMAHSALGSGLRKLAAILDGVQPIPFGLSQKWNLAK